MSSSGMSQIARRDKLLEEIREILHPQLMGEQAMTVAQHRELQAAIANYTEDVLGAAREFQP